jgi:hypothetical protein
MRIPRPLLQAGISNHPNVLTSVVLLSDGRVGEAWGP